MAQETVKPVGIIGLGIMGQAYALNLIPAMPVIGVDPVDSARAVVEAAGGRTTDDLGVLGAECDVILLALASPKVLKSVVGDLAKVLRPGTVVLELGTFAVPDKEAAREVIEGAGGILLDCPVSGTGAQAKVADLVVFASGDQGAVETARPVFDAISKSTVYVGPFGAGMKLKMVANLLVAIHNVAAAEALVMAEKSGLDLQMALDALSAGAGQSRMLEVRGPMMVAGVYEPATMKNEVFMKDMSLILDYAREVETPIPLLAASLSSYLGAMGQGRQKQDTAAVHAVLKSLATPTR